MRLASWNLRYDVKPDDIPLEHSIATLPYPLLPPSAELVGEQPWSARRVAVARTLFAAQVDLIGTLRPFSWVLPTIVLRAKLGFQETLIRQVRDVAELLGSDYAWVLSPSIRSPSMLIYLTKGRRRQGRRRLSGRVQSDLLQAVRALVSSPFHVAQLSHE
jgi:hypothetical protein